MKLTFIGHGSHKLTTNNGKTIYVDPFFPGDYSQGCDILLITHYHGDHTATDLLKQNSGCTVIKPEDALKGGKHQSFDIDGIKITAVQAYNENHKVDECVGYVVESEGKKVYFAGDTSETEDMSGKLKDMKLDCAVLPIDGIYNMDAKGASRCAEIMGVRFAVPAHNDPSVIESGSYSDKGISDFIYSGKLVLKYGESFEI